jgi:hypothetical protein
MISSEIHIPNPTALVYNRVCDSFAPVQFLTQSRLRWS